MTSTDYESGIQPYRIEFVRESTVGVTPADPAWNLYSDNARSFEPTLDPQIGAQDGFGDPDTNNSFAGTELTDLTVMYDLQQWLIDGSSNAQDASYDAVSRTSNNRIPNTHSVVRRIDVGSLDAGNTINGSTSLDTRLYFVGKGGKADVTYTANIDSGQPVGVELSYQFEKGRIYQIDQPASSTTLDVVSTNANDSGTVTIEDEGAGTTEDITITAGGTASGATSFSDIDAIELSSEQPGDITISDGTNDLAVIQGQNSYDQGEGDLGVPALGSGSHASALGSSYELPLDGDSYEFPSGTTMSDNIASYELAVTNNLSTLDQHSGPRPVVTEGKRELEISATVFGQVETYQHTLDMVTNNPQDAVWTFSDPSGDTGSITASNVKATSVGETEEPQQDVIEVDVTLSQQENVVVA